MKCKYGYHHHEIPMADCCVSTVNDAAYRRGVEDALEAVEKVLMQSIPEDAPLLNGEIGRSEAYSLVRGIRKQLLGEKG